MKENPKSMKESYYKFLLIGMCNHNEESFAKIYSSTDDF